MTDRDSDARRRTEGTTTKRRWAESLRPVFATGQELAHLGDATMRTAMAQYPPARSGREVTEIAPYGARAPEGERAAEDDTASEEDAFDDFLATFEPDLPTP
ncbi:hypothetical protein [Halomarina rubra]|uniref:Uncharacterized protein n=1 Tax=Halomarina rubra TaxID=2071873 RepID=A0ABD6B113_9EURY|nr:hypothetical protein [Halomarina rubra]